MANVIYISIDNALELICEPAVVLLSTYVASHSCTVISLRSNEHQGKDKSKHNNVFNLKSYKRLILSPGGVFKILLSYLLTFPFLFYQ